MKRHYLFMLCTVFLYCCLKLLSCASLIKAQNVLPTPYLQCNKITSMDFYVEFIWQQQFAFVNHSFQAFHFRMLIQSKKIKWWVTLQLSWICLSFGDRHSHPPKHLVETVKRHPRTTCDPWARVKGWWLGTEMWDNHRTTMISLWEGEKQVTGKYAVWINILQSLFVDLTCF